MRITFRLKEQRDDDLICYFHAIGEGELSFFVRQALRRGLSRAEQAVQFPATAESPPEIEGKEQFLTTAEEAESKLDNLISNF